MFICEKQFTNVLFITTSIEDAVSISSKRENIRSSSKQIETLKEFGSKGIDGVNATR